MQRISGTFVKGHESQERITIKRQDPNCDYYKPQTLELTVDPKAVIVILQGFKMMMSVGLASLSSIAVDDLVTVIGCPATSIVVFRE